MCQPTNKYIHSEKRVQLKCLRRKRQVWRAEGDFLNQRIVKVLDNVLNIGNQILPLLNTLSSDLLRKHCEFVRKSKHFVAQLIEEYAFIRSEEAKCDLKIAELVASFSHE